MVCSGPAWGDETGKATVMKVEGGVEIRIQDRDWQNAQAGMVLGQEDEIRTGPNGMAQLLLDQGGKTGQIEIQPESRLRFSQLRFDPQSERRSTVLDLAVGNVLVQAEKLSEGDSEFRVRTPNAVSGVRGTSFTVSTQPKKEQPEE